MGAFLGYTVPHHGGDAFDDEIEDEPTRVVRRMELVGNHTMIVDDGVELVDVRGVMPGHHDALPVPSPVSSNDRGWGPSGGPVELKTTFWERGGDKDAEEDGEVTRAIETHTIEPSEREIITSSQVRARRPRRGRAAIIAGLCGAAGVILGSAVGLAANLDPEPPPTLTVPTVVAAPPRRPPRGSWSPRPR